MSHACQVAHAFSNAAHVLLLPVELHTLCREVLFMRSQLCIDVQAHQSMTYLHHRTVAT